MKLLSLPEMLKDRRQHGFFDDFYWYISPHLFTSLAADAGASVAVGASAAGGTVVLTTGGTDNNEAALATTNKPFLFAAEKPLIFEAAIQYAEANADDANVCVGLSSVMNTANMLLDDGAGPAASFSGAILYKVDGETAWRFRTSVGASPTTTLTQHTPGGSAYQTLRIEIRQGSYGATGLEAVPFLGNGLPGAVTSWTQMLDTSGRPIKHAVTYTSAAAMQAGAYVKAGGANSEVLTLDYLGAAQLR